MKLHLRASMIAKSCFGAVGNSSSVSLCKQCRSAAVLGDPDDTEIICIDHNQSAMTENCEGIASMPIVCSLSSANYSET